MQQETYKPGDIVIAQPGKWANNRKPRQAKVLRAWNDNGVMIYQLEEVASGNRGNFDASHILGRV